MRCDVWFDRSTRIEIENVPDDAEDIAIETHELLESPSRKTKARNDDDSIEDRATKRAKSDAKNTLDDLRNVRFKERPAVLPLQDERDEQLYLHNWANSLGQRNRRRLSNEFPLVDDRPLDLFRLKKEVDARGGFDKVCERDQWKDVANALGLHIVYFPTIGITSETPIENGFSCTWSGFAIAAPTFSDLQIGLWTHSATTERIQDSVHIQAAVVYKDLKAHMLTHQTKRPEKCPIQTCEYHTKGFARKYGKNMHTLTHFNGKFTCSFCPRFGSDAEKFFDRVDVFKRHLTSVHEVRQVPPGRRHRELGKEDDISGRAADSNVGSPCSTCDFHFITAQDLYDHLNDCVLLHYIAHKPEIAQPRLEESPPLSEEFYYQLSPVRISSPP